MGYADPALTTVRQPSRGVAVAAVDTLVAEIGGARPTRTELLFHPELVVRGSTGAAPAVP